MLHLVRRVGEVIRIGKSVTVSIKYIHDDAGVKLGIEAPHHLAVHRGEVYARLQDARVTKSINAQEIPVIQRRRSKLLSRSDD